MRSFLDLCRHHPWPCPPLHRCTYLYQAKATYLPTSPYSPRAVTSGLTERSHELARRRAIVQILGDTGKARLMTLRLMSEDMTSSGGRTFQLRGVSISVLAELLLDCIRFSVGRANNAVLAKSPFACAHADLVDVVRSPNIASFLTPRKSSGRTYRTATLTNGIWTDVSVGPGVERSVFEECLVRIFSDSASFQTIGCYKVPSFPPVVNDKTMMEWRTYGILFTLRIIYYTAAPIPASPFLLLALLTNQESFATLTHDEVTALDPSMASRLAPWFKLHEDMARPDVPDDDLLSLCASLEIQVSALCHTSDPI